MMTDFVQAMCRLYFRKVPQIEKFNDKDGSDLKKYLVRFQIIAKITLKVTKYGGLES